MKLVVQLSPPPSIATFSLAIQNIFLSNLSIKTPTFLLNAKMVTTECDVPLAKVSSNSVSQLQIVWGFHNWHLVLHTDSGSEYFKYVSTNSYIQTDIR
jgi:hypothetical protein